MNLSEIKKGDAIAVFGSGFDRSFSKEIVDRTTKTRVYVGTRAYTRRGSLIGGGLYSRVYAQAWDDTKHPAMLSEFRNEMKLKNSIRRIKEFPWGTLNLKEVGDVLALIEPMRLEKNEPPK